MGVREGLKRVCLGRMMVEGSTPGMETVAWYSMIDKMFSGFLDEAMMVFTPASVAIPAAISFVSIPPVPRLDPSVAVLTVECTGRRCVCYFVCFSVEGGTDFDGDADERWFWMRVIVNKWRDSLTVSLVSFNPRGNERGYKERQMEWRKRRAGWN